MNVTSPQHNLAIAPSQGIMAAERNQHEAQLSLISVEDGYYKDTLYIHDTPYAQGP